MAIFGRHVITSKFQYLHLFFTNHNIDKIIDQLVGFLVVEAAIRVQVIYLVRVFALRVKIEMSVSYFDQIVVPH
jgi:hypothetical protein